MKRLRLVRPGAALLLILALTLAACAQALTVSGTALNGVGQEFVAVGPQINAACTAGTITRDQCLSWAQFEVRFKAAYPLAVTAWKTAEAANDKSGAEKATAIIVTLGGTLGQFAALLAGGK